MYYQKYTANQVTKTDGLVKSRKSKLFTRVFCIWYLVFSILTYQYCIIYFIPNTKHSMNSTFYEFIKIDFINISKVIVK